MLETETVADNAGTLSHQLGEYRHWRDELLEQIRSYKNWLEKEEVGEPEDELRIFELIESLKTDKLSIALVAEFSRGKTELINAMFFADYKQRLLPSTAGRTTMCPTEIQYNPAREPCIMLLPIETRKSAATIAELKRSHINWTTLALDIDSGAQMSEALQELAQKKTVSIREAQELGLIPRKPLTDRVDGEQPKHVEIPVWRHAVINFPHPLLEKGLVVLDTPGLNALGSEPELTLSMLPNAHAVLFMLAADTGVTKTDLDVWKNHVKIAARARTAGCIAVLNKIDTMWDDLLSESAVEANILKQVREAARVLGINADNVFPVSAQKGLLGRVKSDMALIERSGLQRLEEKLSTDVVAAKQQLVREKVISEIGGMMQGTQAMIQSRLEAVQAELRDLQGARGKSEDVLQQMSDRLKEQRTRYVKEVESFEVTRRLLSDQIRNLLGHMSMTSFDKLIGETRKSMHESWTTQGLRRGIVAFFQGASKRMDRVSKDADELRHLVESVYDTFHRDHGLTRIRPGSFSLLRFRSDLQRLQADAEAFRNSAALLMSEQHFVIKKFFITMVSRARQLFSDCNGATRAWSKSILTPIYTQIQEHKATIDRRIENLEKIQSNHSNLNVRIEELEQQAAELENQRTQIQALMERIYTPSPARLAAGAER
jgi:predicted GTPase